jgi:hypothetical protein
LTTKTEFSESNVIFGGQHLLSKTPKPEIQVLDIFPAKKELRLSLGFAEVMSPSPTVQILNRCKVEMT